MTTITKERVAEIIHAAGLEPCDYEEVFGSIKTGEIVAMARIALASLEAEPVGEVVLGEYDDCGCHPNARVACIAADGQADWENFKDGTRLYTAPPAPVSVPDEITFEKIAEITASQGYEYSINECICAASWWNACRGAMLQGADSNSPVIPDGYVVVPKRLTAENGAKGLLVGEFSETTFINCPECFGDDECETCDGSGRIEITVPVSWTNIKAIWAKGVENFAAAPQQEVK